MSGSADLRARLAIVGTPRSGNMWLRRLLHSLFGLEELSVDTPTQVRWDRLPPRVVLQLHWPPDDALAAHFDKHGMRSLVLARHPLDVLVSILHFAQRDPRTARWLNGRGGDERSLVGAVPCSEAFRDYAVSERAHRLLALSADWWSSDRLCVRVRFEELVADGERELARVASSIIGGSPPDVADALSQNTFLGLRAETGNDHFWQGRPGLWRELLPASLASEIATAHREVFRALGYAEQLDANPGLDAAQAEANWRTLAAREPVRAELVPRVDETLIPYRELDSPREAELVDRSYRVVLRRDPDPPARERALSGIASGLLSPATFIWELVNSEEAHGVRLLDDATAFAVWARSADERPRLLEAPPFTDERLIAIPWALSRYRGEQRVLDAGSAFATPAYLAALLSAAPTEIVGVDLVAFEVEGMRSVRADLRELPLPSRAFDVIFCLSTLQHIGQDNRAYGLAAEHDASGPARALCELARVLGRGGRLFVTVPCGAPQDLGWLLQLDRDAWNSLFEHAGLFVFEQELYELHAEGWRSVETITPAEVRYAERGPGASAVLCAELRPRSVRQRVRLAGGHIRRRRRS